MHDAHTYCFTTLKAGAGSETATCDTSKTLSEDNGTALQKTLLLILLNSFSYFMT